MYELENGSERLLCAITDRINDPAFVKDLAAVLYYKPEQLVLDIQALCDRLK